MSTETVTIACKLPHGLTIEVGYEVPRDPRGNAQPFIVKTDKYAAVTLNGWNSNLIVQANQSPIAPLHPEPGITNGVPKDLWEAWLAGAGKRHPAVLNGLIYVVRTDAPSAKSQAADVRQRKSGLEPLDPNKMPEGITEAPVDGRPRLTKPAA